MLIILLQNITTVISVLMTSGICKNYTPKIMLYSGDNCYYCCDKGVNVRELVGGPNNQWIKRTPCFKKHDTKIICKFYED